MFDWLKRHSGELTFALTLAIFCLILANVWQRGWVSPDWLKQNREALSALSNIVTVLVLIAGSIFSYYRFFRGRTLSLRADMHVDVSVHDSSADYCLHAITLTATNIGTSTIWNPIPAIDFRMHSVEEADAEGRIDVWEEEPISDTAPNTVPVIESSETVMFSAQMMIPKKYYAATYKAHMRSDSGHTWHTAKTVSNTLQ